MGKAEVGSQAQIKAFNAIGISVQQLKGKNTGQVFEAIADSLKNVTDRARWPPSKLLYLVGPARSLIAFPQGGTARLNALGQAAQQLGIVLSDQQIQNAEVTAHKLKALERTVLEANIASTVTANANSILSLAQALSTLATQVLNFLNSNPQLAMAIIGGLAGSRFGPAGARSALGSAPISVSKSQTMQPTRTSISLPHQAASDRERRIQRAQGRVRKRQRPRWPDHF